MSYNHLRVVNYSFCSVWVMMNKLTRRLSKIPEEVRGEIEPYFVNSDPVLAEDSRKLTKLDDKTADYVRSGLTVSTNTSLYVSTKPVNF